MGSALVTPQETQSLGAFLAVETSGGQNEHPYLSRATFDQSGRLSKVCSQCSRRKSDEVELGILSSHNHISRPALGGR